MVTLAAGRLETASGDNRIRPCVHIEVFQATSALCHPVWAGISRERKVAAPTVMMILPVGSANAKEPVLYTISPVRKCDQR